MEGEKQVRLGNLDKMAVQELQELLDRQEKLLSKQRFLRTLPDGGQKVKEFAAKLQHMISQRQKGCSTQTQSPHPVPPPKQQASDKHGQTEAVMHPQSATGSSDSAFLESDEVLQGNGEAVDSTAALSDAIDSLVLSELTAPRMTDKCEDRPVDGGNLETRFPNSYENIMKKSQTPGTQRAPFKPNSSLKISDIHQLPERYKYKSRSTASGSAADGLTVTQPSDGQTMDSTKEASKVQEESAVIGPQYKFKGAKEISLQESLHLQRHQQANLEKTRTLHAAEQLAERLNIKTVDYNPPTLDMQYRSNTAADDIDSCDSDDNIEGDDDIPD